MSEDKKDNWGAVVGETWTGTDEQIDKTIRANSGVDWDSKNQSMVYLPPLDISAPVPEGMKEAVEVFTAPVNKLQQRAEKYAHIWAPYDMDASMSDLVISAYVDGVKGDRERICSLIKIRSDIAPHVSEWLMKQINEEDE